MKKKRQVKKNSIYNNKKTEVSFNCNLFYGHRSSDRSFDTTIDPCKDDRFDHKRKESSAFYDSSLFCYAGSNRWNGIISMFADACKIVSILVVVWFQNRKAVARASGHVPETLHNIRTADKLL